MGGIISILIGLAILYYLDSTKEQDNIVTTRYEPPEPPVFKRKEQVEVTYKETNKPSRNKKITGDSIDFEEIKNG